MKVVLFKDIYYGAGYKLSEFACYVSLYLEVVT